MIDRLQTLLVALLFIASITHLSAQTPCVDGFADGHPCKEVDLMSKLSREDLGAEVVNGKSTNDIWGWTDPDSGKEYALVGMINGTSFVDISDPVNPVILGRLPGHHEAIGHPERRGENAVWRDIKVYKNHAYMVSEDGDHGMQIFDLTQLRNVTNPPVVFSETSHYDGFKDAHNIVINESSGFAYAVGGRDSETCNVGGLHIIDINNPIEPIYVGCYDAMGYTHDAQCVNYNGPDRDFIGKEVCITANSRRIIFSDLTDKNNPKPIISSFYVGARFAHQGWLTEDHQFFFLNDELDELNSGHTTRTYIWDVRDFDSPKRMGTFESQLNSSDHNLYVKGDLVYQSNYSAGLRILDISQVEDTVVVEAGYFDTYIIDDEASFDGTWSNYPFFESGNVIVSDRQNGLFVLRPTIVIEYPDPDPDPVTTAYDTEVIEEAFTIFPNPATNSIKVYYNKPGGSPTSIRLFDLNGRQVYSSHILFEGSENQINIDTSHLERGLYQITVGNNKFRQVRKILLR